MHTIHDNTTTKWWTLAAVCTGVFMLLLDVTIVNVALPDIEAAFSASLSDLQWVISGYALTLAAFLLMAGSLADRYGRRLLFAIGIVIFTGGSLACGVAQSVLALNLSRGVQGVGGAIMFATSIALLAQAFRGHDRGVAFGVFGAITGISVAVGPVIGGLITSGLSWRWIFLVNVPIGIARLCDDGVSGRRVAQPASGPARLGGAGDVQRGAGRHRARVDSQPGRRLGWVHAGYVDRGRRAAAGRVRRD